MNYQNNLMKSKQIGSAIIVCLMLLTVATLIAINSVSSTILEEKVAGNIRNKQVSFQSAEAGLRAAEIVASTLTDVTLFDGSSGLYPVSNPGDVQGLAGALTNYPSWEDDTNTTWATANTVGLTNPAPQYIIEKYSSADLFVGCSINYEKAAECNKTMYRITARGTGLNTNAETVIQSTYKHP